MTAQSNYVQALASHLEHGLEGLTGGGEAQIVWGVNDRLVVGNRSLTVGNIRRILVESRQVFLLDGNAVYEQSSSADGKRLVPLTYGDRLDRTAPSHISNIVHCAMPGKDAPLTYQIPAKLLSEVLTNTTTRDELPRIDWYGRRPVFDAAFHLCEVGYNPGGRILVHADAVAPQPWAPPADAVGVGRLPPGLRGLLADFCFDSDADRVNVVGLLLTGLLMNHLVAAGKPVAIFNGNQRGVGKTLLAAVLGIVLDGVEPPLIHHTEDEDELAKRLGAKIKPGRPHSLLFFDNRKAGIGGSLLESLALAPVVSVRQLGANEDISRANDFQWVFTVNNARVTPDMTDRSVVVQLRHEGDPRRRFGGRGVDGESLKRDALAHRGQILGELLGMVFRWLEANRPLGAKTHRCKRWAELIGGILQAAGLPEFLSNQDAAIAEVDEDLQELTTLAEHVVARVRAGFYVENGAAVHSADLGRRSQEWVPVFREARLLQQELASAGDRSQATAVGRFIGSRLERTVTIQVGERVGRATLRVQPGRGRQRRYWLDIVWENPTPDATAGGVADGEACDPRPPATGQVGDTPPSAPAACTPPPSETGAVPAAEPSAGGNNLDW